MFIKFADINWLFFVQFLVLCALCKLATNQESHVYLWNLGEIYLVHFLTFWKCQKSELGKFIPNFPLKHVITSTNQNQNICDVVDFHKNPQRVVFP